MVATGKRKRTEKEMEKGTTYSKLDGLRLTVLCAALTRRRAAGIAEKQGDFVCLAWVPCDTDLILISLV